ncbi:MAG: hypothetical protein ACI9WU_001825 [Myxococcota bacterium]
MTTPGHSVGGTSSVVLTPRGLLALAGLFVWQQGALLWGPIVLAEQSPSASAVMGSLGVVMLVMLAPIAAFLAGSRTTPVGRRLAMLFCAAVASAALFVTNSGDGTAAVGMVVALLLSEVVLVLRPHAGVTSWSLTGAYILTILTLYGTVVWGPVVVQSFDDPGRFVRPGVPGLISWFVIHVWALLGLGVAPAVQENRKKR